MSFLFEQALKRRCEQNPDLSVLEAQWAYDRRLVSDALQTVGRTFPHYSRHDASHSSAILVQLARVLGQARIEALSATDLWLLLEAAYQHDIGMVVTDKQAQEWMRSNEFRGHMEKLRYAEDRELAHAAELILARTRKIDTSVATWPLEVRRALELVLAEFGRQRHPQQAERIVRDPVGTIGLLSPRTPLIPDRLFRLLGRICALHGRSFEETMRLPFRETGVGTDDAHPRFVACVLRLGDLLDLDNGRFCPVMMASFGQLPPSSSVHVEKHAAIRHLDIGPDRIEVEAECESYPAYEVTEQWLTWLRDELKNQMARWVEIAPDARFGALPSAGAIGARLAGYEMLEPGRRPRFEVDREAILSLVKGANLYEEPFSAMRELLQNAVDATIIRLWREKWSRFPKEKLDTREPEDLRKALGRWPIDVKITRRKTKGQAGEARWRITVRDRGTGIDLDEVRYLQRIGGSSKNERKRREMADMPEWMWPSGIFGIGLQSVFMFTSEIRITTRHHESHKVHRIVLRNGGEPGSDGLLIKSIHGRKVVEFGVGTNVEFDLEVEKIPRQWSLSEHEVEAGQAFRSFDFLVDDELPIHALKLVAAARRFGEACLAKVRIPEVKVPAEAAVAEGVTTQWGPFFDRNTGLVIRALGAGLSYSELVLRYRGAPVARSRGDVRHFRIECDAYFGQARDVLRLSRDEPTRVGQKEIDRRLGEALVRALPGYLDHLRGHPHASHGDALAAASLEAYLYGVTPSSVHGDEWMSIAIPGDCGAVSLRELTAIDMIVAEYAFSYFDDSPYAMRGLYVVPGEPYRVYLPGVQSHWVAELLTKSHVLSYLGEEERERATLEVFAFSRKGRLLPEGANEPRRILPHLHRYEWRRGTMPCASRYVALQYMPVADPISTYDVIPGVWPRMICPFTVENDERIALHHLPEYVEWTAKNADGGPRDQAEVAKALWEFLQEADAAMAKKWEGRKTYDLALAKHALSRWLK